MVNNFASSQSQNIRHQIQIKTEDSFDYLIKIKQQPMKKVDSTQTGCRRAPKLHKIQTALYTLPLDAL